MRHILISALADICLRRYIKKNISRPWRMEFKEALKSFGFVNISDTIPLRYLFTEYAGEELPGICLAGSRHKANMTQKQLSELTGIPQSHISEMENGKRAIGEKTAKILAKVLSVNYRVFL